MRFASIAALALACGILPAQYISVGSATVAPNTTTTFPTPFGQYWTGNRSQYLYTAGELIAAGVPAGVPITAIGFDVVAPNPNAAAPITFQNYEVRLANTPTTDLVGGWDAPAFTTVYGPAPFTEPSAPGWADISFVAPFVWNGTDSILVEICMWNGPPTVNYTLNASVNSSSTTYVSALTDVDDLVAPCAGTAITFTQNQRPDIRFCFGCSLLTSSWQLNSAAASLTVNGLVLSSGLSPTGAVTTTLPGIPQSVAIESTRIGSGHDIYITPTSIVPVGAGGIVAPGGQIVNVDLLGSPGGFVFGSGLTPGLPPFPGNYTVMYTPPGIGSISGQAVWTDPSQAIGLVLSQACEIDTSAGVTTVLAGDDFYQNIPLLGSVTFYGQTFTSISVSTNGWIKMGNNATGNDLSENADDFVNGLTGPGTPAPTIALLWEDLDMGNRPTSFVRVTEAAGGIITVEYVDADYFPTAALGNITCTIDPTVPGIPLRITMDYTGYIGAPPIEGLVGVTDGTTSAIPSTSVPRNLAAAGAINTYTSVNPVESIFQNFDGTGTLVPPIAAEAFDLGGLVLQFSDASGAGTFLVN